jgi:hypothetical protein
LPARVRMATSRAATTRRRSRSSARVTTAARLLALPSDTSPSTNATISRVVARRSACSSRDGTGSGLRVLRRVVVGLAPETAAGDGPAPGDLRPREQGASPRR